jgi:hypothetical protein
VRGSAPVHISCAHTEAGRAHAPAGFQSVQFRVLENTLGLRSSDRIFYSQAPYTAALEGDHQKVVTESEQVWAHELSLRAR